MKYAKVFADGSTETAQEMIDRVKQVHYQTVRNARVKLDVAAIVLHRALVQYCLNSRLPEWCDRCSTSLRTAHHNGIEV